MRRMSRHKVISRAGLSGLVLLAAPTVSAWAQTAGAETVIVSGIAPLPGTAIDAGKIAGEVESVSVPSLTQDHQQDVLPNAIATQFASVNVNDEQGSQFQPDFVFRGFEASPISGVAEGIAVYQDGVRLNEAFGDTVNWDLIPEFAVNRLTLQSNNPVFGLNALGGAVTLEMKSGLDFEGTAAQLSGGSFGNVTGNGEYGARLGNFGVYLGIGASHDDGFRYCSPATLSQLYGDLAYQSGPWTLHLSISGAFNDIGAVGPTPVELLVQDPRAIFTFPQSMRDEAELVQFRGSYRLGGASTVSFNSYYRHFHQSLVDGNTTDVTICANDAGQLCLEGAGNYPDDALYDKAGNVVPASALPPGVTPGETDFTRTNAKSLGAAIQMSFAQPVGGRANNLVLGASVDDSLTGYAAHGELGSLSPSLEVVGAGVVIDQGLSPTAQPPIEAPVDVGAKTLYSGFYVIDVLDVTRALSLTLSGRLNTASLGLNDKLGDTLNSSQSYSRVNPGAGLTYRFSRLVTAYGGYSESNRAPTAGELSCADPSSPCLLDAFLVSDPPLKQVVSRDYEAGLRGGMPAVFLPGTLTWNASFYRTDTANDILLLATDINGFGYFQNSGTTRRQGADLRLAYRDDRWRLSASYSYLDATFRNAEILSSNSPAADANGLIYVVPGDRLPLNPADRVAMSGDYTLLPGVSIGADVRLQSGQYLAGDQSNQEPKMPGFATVNLRGAWRFMPSLELFAEVQNLFDRAYDTYGAFTQLDGLPPNVNLRDPRTFSPAPPRLFYGGLRLNLP